MVGKNARTADSERVSRVIEGSDVDDYLQNEVDYSAFSSNERLQQRLRELLWNKREIFKGLGKIKGVRHKIELKEGVKPICQPLRRRSPKEESVEREAMQKLLQMEVLEHAVSPWAANNVFVRKKDGGIRVTSDFRALNDATVTDTYPMEDVRNVLNWLAGKNVFSTFDLKDGFFQVELEEESKPLTAIRTVLGLLQYRRLPQGMKNSPGTFQRIVNVILGAMKGTDVMAFMDDVSLGTAGEEEHLDKLEALLDKLYASGARLKLSKCKFGSRSVEVLGHRVDKDGLHPSAGHVESIKSLVEPASGDELMRFLGLVNYFSDFVDHFAETAKPLYEALKGTGFSKKRRHGQRLVFKDWDSRWGEAQKDSWKQLKDALSDPEMLTAPLRGAPKRVMTDASSYGLGGVLLQQGVNGNWSPVSFTSRLLKKAEMNYTPTEKECLAVVHALHKWRHYLHGESFTAVTDHLSLKWLLSLNDPRDRLARGVVEIMDHDFTIEHRGGKELVVPDTLSRDAVPKPLCQRCYCPMNDRRIEDALESAEAECISRILESQLDDQSPLREADGADSVLAVVNAFAPGPSRAEFLTAQETEFGDLKRYVKSLRGGAIDDNGLMCVARAGHLPIVVPKSLQKSVLAHVHGSKLHGHYKVDRTLSKLRGKYWWKTMVEDTVSFIRNCVVCAATDDVAPRRQAPMEARHPTRRFQTVAIDVQTITPRAKSGNKKVLAMIDVFTRFARAVGIKDEKADIIADALLKEWISLFGPMEVLQSDGGTNIMGKIVEHLTNELGVGRTQTYPLHPQANGTVERWNRTLARDLACFVATGEDDWDEHVALACKQ